MARKIISNGLGKVGNGIFSFLSRCEDKGILPKLAAALKVWLLGILVTAIASCSKGGIPPLVMCYEPVAVYPEVTELEVSPNPTNGAEKISVKAKATLKDLYVDSTTYITSARCYTDKDTVLMQAVDGAFDETSELLEAELPVSGLEPGTTSVQITVDCSWGSIGYDLTDLIVTDKEK
ncbi:hypothetical protein JXM67_12695 [candidate division WOR-3 bacterium]|nr:hypothetical protein [candidate division WOR-3 bacterium]